MNLIFLLIKAVIIIIIGVFYLPLNMLLMKVGDLTQAQKKYSFMYFVWYIIFLPLWVIVSGLSVPYEKLVESAH